MSNFQIGDEVSVISEIHYNLKKGSIGYIHNIDLRQTYPIGVYFQSYPSKVYYFSEYDLKKIKRNEVQKEMTIHDLKPGMVVELKDGRKKLVLESKLRPFLIDLQHYQSTCDYDKNMVNLLESKTINKVYEITSAANLPDLLNGKSLNLIWERKPKPKEMTMEELEKTLGYPIKIVKEKEKLPF